MFSSLQKLGYKYENLPGLYDKFAFSARIIGSREAFFHDD